MNEANLNERLTVLARAGWQLRTCYTLRRPDKDEGWQSYHADSLESVVGRAEASGNQAPQRPKPRPKQVPAEEPAEAPSGGVEIDAAMARRLASSNVATGLVSTSTYTK